MFPRVLGGIKTCPQSETESEAEAGASLMFVQLKEAVVYVCGSRGSGNFQGRFHINSPNSFSADQIVLICSAPENDRSGRSPQGGPSELRHVTRKQPRCHVTPR